MAHTVTLSLSDEAYQVWRAFPKGTRSPSIAAILEDAEKLRVQELVILALRNKLKISNRLITQMDMRIMNEGLNPPTSYPSDDAINKLKELL